MTIDTLNDTELALALKKRGMNMASYVVECGSTQDYARASSVVEDTVFAAVCQPEGRGRLDRRFISREGGCYFTLVTALNGRLPHSFMPVVSVAIVEVMKTYGIDALIKWPNDILVGGKKLCGILASSDTKYAYLGIGINAFNDLTGLETIAVSLSEVGVKNKTRVGIIADTVREIYRLLEKYFAEVLEKYKTFLNIFGKSVTVFQGENKLEGRVAGIDGNGFLLLESGGDMAVVMSGDVFVAD
ncbi:MAG: biotin--[acetyl-CoA-carboxylase] ligase [Clostridia bacterium]|nr:biotin--[acetyl-CoA-carboxylase] ligase [Clostridia bacterium]